MTERQDGISVVMPTYNGELFIGSALESLCHEWLHINEVVIVDDGSSDSTLGIAERFAARLPIRVLRPAPRRNWLAMSNIGISEATSKWTAILHQDDQWMPTRTRDLQHHMDDDASALLVMDALFIDAEGRRIGAWRPPRSLGGRSNAKSAEVAPSLYIQNWIAVAAATFRTDAALAVGGLDEQLWYTADWDLWMKLARSYPVVRVGQPGASFRIHGASQTISGSSRLECFRKQHVTVQRRHEWAPLRHRDPALIRRAGALSTETNVLLAGLLHHGREGGAPWAALQRAGTAATVVYLRNSTITSRLSARVIPRLRGRLHASLISSG